MKKRIGLIGLGNLSAKFSTVLCNNSSVEIVAVCDKNEYAVGRYMYGATPYYKDYHELAECELDYVYIATDPQTHYEIADFFLDCGIPVLSEKPATVTFAEYRALIDKATERKLFYNVIYHFRYSYEILWLRRHINDFGKLIYASARFDDPYFEDNAILPGRELLMGAWMDSASNILGTWSFLFPDIVPYHSCSTIERDTEHNLPIHVVANFEWKQIPFSIMISWKNHTRNKEMTFVFEKGVVYIDFPNQEIYLNGKLEMKHQGKQSTMMHYVNFFNGFDQFCCDRQNDSITELLYKF